VSLPARGRARPIDDASFAVGVAVATFGPLTLAALCIPVREHVTTANLALLFVVVVVSAAGVGGRRAGALAALVSTMAFDFFLTAPYGSLKIDRAADFETAALLLVIGLLTSEIVAFAHRNREGSRRELDQLHRITEIVGAGADPRQLASTVRSELIRLLSLLDCRFEPPPFEVEFTRVERDGTFAAPRRRFVAGELSLPEDGAEIPVVAGHESFGRFVLVPDLDVGVSRQARVVAVALVEQLAAAFAVERTTLAKNAKKEKTAG
jgi:Domain of unknown function (DUF4118)